MANQNTTTRDTIRASARPSPLQTLLQGLRPSVSLTCHSTRLACQGLQPCRLPCSQHCLGFGHAVSLAGHPARASACCLHEQSKSGTFDYALSAATDLAEPKGRTTSLKATSCPRQAGLATFASGLSEIPGLRINLPTGCTDTPKAEKVSR